VIANPTDQLTLNLKATLFRKSGPSTTMMEQLFGCPLGRPNPSNPGIQPAPQFQDCNVNKVVGPEAIEPAVTVSEFSYLPLIGQWGGRHLFFTYQYLGDFKADYAFSDGLALHSITSYYNLDQGDYGPGIPSSMNIIPELERTLTWDFTQEVRLESDFSTPFNFMVGGLYQRAGLDQRLNVLFPNLLVSLPPGHFVSPGAYLAQQEETRSGFGQITYDILSNLKLLAGGRYTSEGKSLVATSATTGAYLPNALPNLDFTNFSPDVTLTWSATPKTNVFASYREGAKSGGYSTSSYATSVTASDSYRNEIAKGFEGGIKRSMLDGHLYFEAIAYTYKYDNLQVSFFNANSLAFATSSVGSARSYGAELSATYRPPAIEGVTISGNVNYNHLRYLAGAAGQCYTGQSIAEGCRVDIVDGGYTAQDLAGLTPDRSADWTGSLTLGYQRPITAALDIGITVGANYSSAFNPDPAQDPLARQAGYALINSEVRLATHDDKYEVALIGNNLCDVIRIQNAYELPFTGNAAATGTATAGQLSDKFGFANQPMTLELRFRARF
jgi:outer membrane receptor protein involved in Fe transport